MSKTNDIDVLDILIAFVKGCHYENKERDWTNCIYSNLNGKDYWIWNADYLLNQILRQIDVPPERYVTSKGALEMWDKLKPTGKKGKRVIKAISDCYYRERLTIHNTLDEKVGLYKGAEKKPSSHLDIKEGNIFTFNDVFHLEHIIPIHKIKEELLSLSDEDLTKDKVSEILEKIYVCRMLKSEDRSIESKYKSNRTGTAREIVKEVYKDIDVEFPNE